MSPHFWMRCDKCIIGYVNPHIRLLVHRKITLTSMSKLRHLLWISKFGYNGHGHWFVSVTKSSHKFGQDHAKFCTSHHHWWSKFNKPDLIKCKQFTLIVRHHIICLHHRLNRKRHQNNQWNQNVVLHVCENLHPIWHPTANTPYNICSLYLQFTKLFPSPLPWAGNKKNVLIMWVVHASGTPILNWSLTCTSFAEALMSTTATSKSFSSREWMKTEEERVPRGAEQLEKLEPLACRDHTVLLRLFVNKIIFENSV